MKVLHVVSSLNPGGIEKWLLDFTSIPSSNKYSILKQTENKCFFDQYIKNNNVIIHALSKVNFLSFLLKFYTLLKKEKYDVVHFHVHFSSGILALISLMAGVKIRVVHSHISYGKESLSLFRAAYQNLMRLFISCFGTKFIAVSEDAANSLFIFREYELLPCGIVLEHYSERKKVSSNDDFIIGHVGRFNTQKNHKFMLEIIKKCKEKNFNFKFKFVGEGVLKNKFVNDCERLGLNHLVEFIRPTTSVHEHMINDFDCFIFPSLFEGLGLALIEAQYYGLPCVASDAVPEDAIIGNVFVKGISSENAVSEWVECLSLIQLQGDVDFTFPKEIIYGSNVNIVNNIEFIESIYESV